MNSRYKCLIAEDSMLDRDAIEMYLSKIETLSIEAVCSSGLEAVTLLQQKEIDIVFSDIDMPDLSGIELLQSLKKAPVFIFISSYSEHAAESYSLDVIDFIVKPVTLARLAKATHKAIEYIELKQNALAGSIPAATDLLQNVVENTADHFFIKENTDYIRIDYNHLLYIESMGNFSKLHTLQKKHLALISLKNMAQQLPAAGFMRVHKQFIINLQHIISLSSDGEVYLTGGHAIPLGDMYKTALMEVINKKMLFR
jgi:two-component system LytT family response regulator